MSPLTTQSKTLDPEHIRSLLPQLFILLLVALCLKGAGIINYSLGPDELMVWSIAQGETISELLYRNSFEVHPPLEPLIRYLLFRITNDADILRMIYGLIAIGSSALLSLSLHGRYRLRGGIILFTILSLSQTITHVSILLRGYLFLFLFLSLALFLMSHVCSLPDRPRTQPLLVLTAALILAGLSHVSGFLAAPSIIITAVIFSSTTPGAKRILPAVPYLLLVSTVAGLVYLFQFKAGTGAAQWRELTKSPLFAECANFNAPIVVIHRILDLFSVLPSSLQTPITLIFSGILGGVIYLCASIFCFQHATHMYFYSLLTIVSAVGAHLLGLYPLSSPRHMLFLLPALLLPITIYICHVLRSIHRLRLALVSASTIGLIISFSDLHFKNHPDFAMTREKVATLNQKLAELSRQPDPIITSRFGLLYILKYRDDLSTFYMEQTAEHTKLKSAPIHTCVDPFLWQTTHSSLLTCLSNENFTSQPDAPIWLTSIGFTDNFLTRIYLSSLKNRDVLADHSSDGVVLFKTSLNSLRKMLDDGDQTASGHDNHCTGPIHTITNR